MYTSPVEESFALPVKPEIFIKQMLNWSKQFNISVLMDSCGYRDAHSRYDVLLACGVQHAFFNVDEASDFQKNTGCWLFGHINFEYGLRYFNIPPRAVSKPGFRPCYFFVPQYILSLKDDLLTVHSTDGSRSENDLFSQLNSASTIINGPDVHFTFQPSESENCYFEKIENLLKEIRYGNCYEINYCQHFYAAGAHIDPYYMYQKLKAVSPNPFAAFYRLGNDHLICASPERFIQRQSHQLISQPIKGTAKRDLTDEKKDAHLMQGLASSEKDRCENVMIVDLVRNDMSKIAEPGSVQVPELFTVDCYPQVYQMKSTIECHLAPKTPFSKIIEAMFPMGSMTGAPKKKVLELTAAHEVHPRGIYSGTMGYVDPYGNFDFNVVIRSLMYYAEHNYLEYFVGGGITLNSNPVSEYEECLLKAKAIQTIFS